MAPRKTKGQQAQPYPIDTVYAEGNAEMQSYKAFSERSSEQLNLRVLQRYNPQVISLENVAPYAVVYIFSPESKQWEKSGIEGSAFICGLKENTESAERFEVIVLNRRGLDNFNLELKSEAEVEFTEEYIIMQSTDNFGEPCIYGLWIFSEPPPSSTAHQRDMVTQKIQECLGRAKAGQAIRQAQVGNGQFTQENSAPMERQLSLKELFGQQGRQSISIQQPRTPPAYTHRSNTNFFLGPSTEISPSTPDQASQAPGQTSATIVRQNHLLNLLRGDNT